METSVTTIESIDYSAMAQAFMDILFENDKLGNYDLLIIGYLLGCNEAKAVRVRANVVFKSNKFRMPVVVVKVGDKYQDFYYNNGEQVWKLLSEPKDYTIQSWWNEEQLAMPRPKVPDFLKGKKAAGAQILAEVEDKEIIRTK